MNVSYNVSKSKEAYVIVTQQKIEDRVSCITI